MVILPSQQAKPLDPLLMYRVRRMTTMSDRKWLAWKKPLAYFFQSPKISPNPKALIMVAASDRPTSWGFEQLLVAGGIPIVTTGST